MASTKAWRIATNFFDKNFATEADATLWLVKEITRALRSEKMVTAEVQPKGPYYGFRAQVSDVEQGLTITTPRASTRGPRGPRRKLVYWNMAAGDSVFIPGGRDTHKKQSATATQCARRMGNDVKFITRYVNENGVQGVRVWRVQ